MIDRFHHVVAHDDCERHKPEPDPFLKAAGLLGVAPSALVEAGRRLGA